MDDDNPVRHAHTRFNAKTRQQIDRVVKANGITFAAFLEAVFRLRTRQLGADSLVIAEARKVDEDRRRRPQPRKPKENS